MKRTLIPKSTTDRTMTSVAWGSVMKGVDDFELAEMLGVRPSWVAARGRRDETPSIPPGRYKRTADYTHQTSAVDVTDMIAVKLMSCGLIVAESSKAIQ